MDLANNCPGIIQDWIFPPTCLLCGDAGSAGRDLCIGCANSLPLNLPACSRCGRLLPFASAEPCGHCLRHPPAYQRTFALFRYEEPVRHLIHGLKFHARYPCARLLGQLMADALTETASKPGCILPVPLHSSRYRERGHNQAIEIARTVSRRLRIPLALDSCIRAQATQPQTELNAEQRLRNMKKAFRIVKTLPSSHLAILDDVVTTGATVNELAKALLKAGAERIDVWACARA
ncbi:MAG: ComF family protein [Methylococcaceae bacterium]|nr:ComF family protein [Methylococcaceae bacterium]